MNFERLLDRIRWHLLGAVEPSLSTEVRQKELVAANEELAQLVRLVQQLRIVDNSENDDV